MYVPIVDSVIFSSVAYLLSSSASCSSVIRFFYDHHYLLLFCYFVDPLFIVLIPCHPSSVHLLFPSTPMFCSSSIGNHTISICLPSPFSTVALSYSSYFTVLHILLLPIFPIFYPPFCSYPTALPYPSSSICHRHPAIHPSIIRSHIRSSRFLHFFL